MKIANNIEVSSRSYYYLLDFNDRDDWKELSKFNVQKLSELNLEQYLELFKIATQKEIENLTK